MTDAEFMLSYVARKRKLYANFHEIEKDEPPCVDLAQGDKEELAILDALEALAKIGQYSDTPNEDVYQAKEALRAFRAEMDQAGG